METISGPATSIAGEIAGAPPRLWKPWSAALERTPPSPVSAAIRLRPTVCLTKSAAAWTSAPPATGKSVCSTSTITGPPSAPTCTRTTIGLPPVSSSASSADHPTTSPVRTHPLARGKKRRSRASRLEIPPLSGCRCRLSERLNGLGLVVHDVEDGIQSRNLHHVVNLIREVEQLQLSPLLPHACESTDQMPQACAV